MQRLRLNRLALFSGGGKLRTNQFSIELIGRHVSAIDRCQHLTLFKLGIFFAATGGKGKRQRDGRGGKGK